jgi:hypothetical protein
VNSSVESANVTSNNAPTTVDSDHLGIDVSAIPSSTPTVTETDLDAGTSHGCDETKGDDDQVDSDGDSNSGDTSADVHVDTTTTTTTKSSEGSQTTVLSSTLQKYHDEARELVFQAMNTYQKDPAIMTKVVDTCEGFFHSQQRLIQGVKDCTSISPTDAQGFVVAVEKAVVDFLRVPWSLETLPVFLAVAAAATLAGFFRRVMDALVAERNTSREVLVYLSMVLDATKCIVDSVNESSDVALKQHAALVTNNYKQAIVLFQARQSRTPM